MKSCGEAMKAILLPRACREMGGNFVKIPMALLNAVADPLSDLDAFAIAVWVALRSYADFGSEEGATVRDQVAAARAGCSVPTFKRRRKSLQQAGWVDWRSGKITGRSNRYIVRDTPRRVGHSELPVDQTDAPLDHSDPPGSITVSDIPRASVPRVSTYTPEFVDFWTAYPRKRGKGRAYDRWKKLTPDPSLIQRAIENFLREMRAEKRKTSFLPYPAKWLGEWEEWLEVDQSNEPDHHADSMARSRDELDAITNSRVSSE